MENFRICPVMRGTYCQRQNCACWYIDHCGLIVNNDLIADRIAAQTRLVGVELAHAVMAIQGKETKEDLKEIQNIDQLIEDMS